MLTPCVDGVDDDVADRVAVGVFGVVVIPKEDCPNHDRDDCAVVFTSTNPFLSMPFAPAAADNDDGDCRKALYKFENQCSAPFP